MMLKTKERAAASANSDHPAKENLHKPKYSIQAQQTQARFASYNGRVLRWINVQRRLFSPVETIISGLREDGIPALAISKSIGYLSAKGYISVSRNQQAVKMGPDGIRLLAGAITDSNITV